MFNVSQTAAMHLFFCVQKYYLRILPMLQHALYAICLLIKKEEMRTKKAKHFSCTQIDTCLLELQVIVSGAVGPVGATRLEWFQVRLRHQETARLLPNKQPSTFLNFTANQQPSPIIQIWGQMNALYLKWHPYAWNRNCSTKQHPHVHLETSIPVYG